ncbi:unnamed protein product [Microthlaspi erraticum]|uniref:F-box domain-containing protein n=1 Tax=Microthlaspi erraticum TaxID=1685480 RepID=A0A6D2LCI3_9BRAS|nr:unnamed protein product [Microthlaspi erraticum]
MTRFSDLSWDLIWEIFARVPLTSLNVVRSTCKNWNGLTRKQILGQKAAARSQFLEFMMINSSVSSLRCDLQGIQNSIEDDGEDLLDHLSIKQITSIPSNTKMEITEVFHCDGLLLCLVKEQEDHFRLLVWNPYLGQTKWIQPRNKLYRLDKHALGYNKNGNHKILSLVDDYDSKNGSSTSGVHIDVYDFSTDSWRFLDVDPSWDLGWCYNGVSLKGNTYFFGQQITDIVHYVVCFNFETESFGPRLPLPFQPPCPCLDIKPLSWVRDEKLAALYYHCETTDIIEIWISTEVEPNAVSWSSFFTLDLSLINGLPDGFPNYFETSFLIDEEKKVAVLFGSERYGRSRKFRYQMAYVVGGDGYFKSVNTGIVSSRWVTSGKLVCSSYVPSLVHVLVY